MLFLKDEGLVLISYFVMSDEEVNLVGVWSERERTLLSLVTVYGIITIVLLPINYVGRIRYY